jgi:hypothetical protein
MRHATSVWLAEELTDARRRGLADLDLNTRRQPQLQLPVLTSLAIRYARGRYTGSRVALIRRLLADALISWTDSGEVENAEFIRRLFFRPGGELDARVDQQALLHEARQLTGLTTDQFDVRRRALFREFARLLQSFVEQRTEALPAEQEQLGSEAVPAEVSRESHRRGLPLLIGGVTALLAVVGLVVGLVVIHGHSNNPGRERGSIGGGTTASPGTALTFDDLGGGSTILSVYPGVRATTQDRRPNGTFRSGQRVGILCKTTGRTVHSDPAVGERSRSSNVWVQINGSPGLVQYATLTYGDVAAAVLDQLPRCAGSA